MNGQSPFPLVASSEEAQGPVGMLETIAAFGHARCGYHSGGQLGQSRD